MNVSNNRGFTMAELLITLAVIAILSTTVLVYYKNTVRDTEIEAIKQGTEHVEVYVKQLELLDYEGEELAEKLVNHKDFENLSGIEFIIGSLEHLYDLWAKDTSINVCSSADNSDFYKYLNTIVTSTPTFSSLYDLNYGNYEDYNDNVFACEAYDYEIHMGFTFIINGQILEIIGDIYFSSPDEVLLYGYPKIGLYTTGYDWIKEIR